MVVTQLSKLQKQTDAFLSLFQAMFLQNFIARIWKLNSMPEITYKVKQKRQKQVHSISLAEELRFIAAQVLEHNLKKQKTKLSG